MHSLIRELYPVCRSITGDGLRATLHRIGQEIPLEISDVVTGTAVYDWIIPDEWNVRDAWVKDPSGTKVIDFQASNLHLVNYSPPVSTRMDREELLKHLHSLPEQPDLIPYRTSYYRPEWGFCLAHRDLEALPPGEYEVLVDSTLGPGALSFGECLVPGASADEVLVSVHVCHPSLANDNLSGIAVATELARTLLTGRPNLTWRFLFVPATVGAIAWLALNHDRVGDMRAGLVLSGVGDPGRLTYKRSRLGTSLVDRAVEHVLKHRGAGEEVLPFAPYGYDERQYCSPGFNLPVGCLMRTPHGEYPEYHTSADDPSFVRAEALLDTYSGLLDIAEILEHDRVYLNVRPHGEPQLGRRGLYRQTGGDACLPGREQAMLWVLNQSDGSVSLLDVAARSGMPFAVVRQAADELVAAGLLTEAEALCAS